MRSWQLFSRLLLCTLFGAALLHSLSRAQSPEPPQFLPGGTQEPPLGKPTDPNAPPVPAIPAPPSFPPAPADGSGTVNPQPAPTTLPNVLVPQQGADTAPVLPVHPGEAAGPLLPGVPGSPALCPLPADPPAPVVVVRVRVAACAVAGQPIHYRICVKNLSPAPAHHVLVRNPLPVNATFLRAIPTPTINEAEIIWALGTLPGCCSREVNLYLQPTDNQDVTNCARVQFEHGQCTITRIAGLGPQAIPGGSGLPPFPPGQAPPGTGQPPITTPPGTKPPAVKIPGQQPPDTKPPGQQPPDTKPPVGKAVPPGKLELEITGPERAFVDAPVQYTIRLRNVGKGLAENTMIASRLPDDTKFLKAGEGGRFLAGQVAWVLGNVQPGESRTVTFTIKATAGGKICHQPYALAGKNLEASAKICTQFRGVAALQLRVEDSKDPVAVNEKTSYVIVIKNTGNAPVTNMTVKAVLPAGKMAFVGADGPSKFAKAGNPQIGETIQFEKLKTLAPGTAVRFEVEVRALQPGDVRFAAEMTADQLILGGPVREEESTNIVPANGG